MAAPAVGALAPDSVEKWRAVDRPPERGEVHFEHVKFRYHDDSDESCISLDDDGEHRPQPGKNGNGQPYANRWVLDDLDFSVASV